ncbi:MULTISPECIES: metalloregulator ArsR/SmtB family transcription factor [Rhizobium/Agrobacterium group]|uniref:ArsR/SmtB family transcription factor n=1 Tax=Rhizobium/Agrobacterium group TaxID=227290 RepID=UPI001ADAAF23|nr:MULTISPECIES: metalloregulator ArsR/SmtB family transcription factor [Rhizobium/Agrobacterium group]MBO9112462.1 winged helix-turn-helix transcriptional regulator [Agrobacterium sp. S2/73]QXZ75972.1 winged helix-turn-helix transcriptional regulator [Agrobacterium sp. S7/73]QYA17017.1 winged helix-turn-helix transcriptional regulator [Rhizobium sp. AB2/73]UEQ85410.1 winged helix-turn-helix transcriptional regulator [Rhizobium sp. AB2/73]
MGRDDVFNFSEDAVLLSAMANKRRLQVLVLLQEAERSVNELATAVGISQSALSQHLGKLRKHNLVSTRRDGQTIYYRSNDERVLRILHTLAALGMAREEYAKSIGQLDAY